MRLSLEIMDMNVNPMQKKIYIENPTDIQLVAAWLHSSKKQAYFIEPAPRSPQLLFVLDDMHT